jgi:hypothetical protein
MNKLSFSKRKFGVFLSIAMLCSFFVIYSTSLTVAQLPNSPKLSGNATTTVGYKILIDEAHMPIYGISNESVAFENNTAFSTFADLLTAEGYTIDTLDENDTIEYSVLEGYNLLIIVAPTDPYTAEEISTIYNWTTDGNSLLLISDWGSLFGNSSNYIANAFGYSFGLEYIYDSDDYNTYTYWITFNESNIKTHDITAGVSAVEIYLGDGIISDPIGAMDIIATDLDDTTSWSGGGFANNVPIVSARENWGGGNGKIVLISDSNIWCNFDGDDNGIYNINELNNSLLALNVVHWLSPITEVIPLQGIYFSFITVFVILISFIRIKRKKR